MRVAKKFIDANNQRLAIMTTVPTSQNSKHRYTLAELVQQCNPKAENPADLALWDAAHPVGNEVLDDMFLTFNSQRHGGEVMMDGAQGVEVFATTWLPSANTSKRRSRSEKP